MSDPDGGARGRRARVVPAAATSQSLTGRLSALLTEQQATSVFVPDVPAAEATRDTVAKLFGVELTNLPTASSVRRLRVSSQSLAWRRGAIERRLRPVLHRAGASQRRRAVLGRLLLSGRAIHARFRAPISRTARSRPTPPASSARRSRSQSTRLPSISTLQTATRVHQLRRDRPAGGGRRRCRSFTCA